MDRANQMGRAQQQTFPASNPALNRALRPVGGATDKLDLRGVMILKAENGIDRVFLSPANDEAGDDMNNAHDPLEGPQRRLLRRSLAFWISVVSGGAIAR